MSRYRDPQLQVGENHSYYFVEFETKHLQENAMNGVLGHLRAHIGQTGSGQPPEDGEMNEMTQNICKSGCFNTHFIPNNSGMKAIDHSMPVSGYSYPPLGFVSVIRAVIPGCRFIPLLIHS